MADTVGANGVEKLKFCGINRLVWESFI